ncbi:hypothetical protein TOPH_08561 [Tolypocladium ophioglossoides CBS 100239]|uniref:Uncharacterized protein n=1 Tax=Tolypocladium ophioglossoides (strain CBS 100239) TaxID=1163406 RepID=A0A0L0MZ82_TOLOC|nr:hypothetical protein TOPH_08561 [Tolypocladium ophioglossoides CBS 100239]
MSYSLYDASIALAHNAVRSLSAILKKGEAAPNAASLPEASIHPDMKPLSFQVHLVTDVAQKLQARLMGTEPATLENNLKTFADFHARIAQVEELLAKADRDTINKRAAENVPLALGPDKTVQIPGMAYASGFGVPNVFFHLTTAYDILRKEGVPLGKMDYLLSFVGEYIPKE